MRGEISCSRNCDAEIGSGWVQGSRYKVHNVLDQDQSEYDPSVAAIWDHAEKFDPKTERLFRYLQVCTLAPSCNHVKAFNLHARELIGSLPCTVA